MLMNLLNPWWSAIEWIHDTRDRLYCALQRNCKDNLWSVISIAILLRFSAGCRSCMRNCELSPHRLAQRSHARPHGELRGIIAASAYRRGIRRIEPYSFRICNHLVPVASKRHYRDLQTRSIKLRFKEVTSCSTTNVRRERLPKLDYEQTLLFISRLLVTYYCFR